MAELPTDGKGTQEERDRLQALVMAIDQMLNPGHVPGNMGDRQIGFCLFLYSLGNIDTPYAHRGRLNYASNGADRNDILSMMKELVANWEGRGMPAPEGKQ
jgi:hypothetical protein